MIGFKGRRGHHSVKKPMKIIWAAAIGLLCFFVLPLSAAIIYFEFRGDGDGPSDTAAVEAAVRNAESNAAASGYYGCQLTKYVYYPDTFGWVASAWMTCSKDTTPPPTPPPHTYNPPTIFPPVRDGTNHTVRWDSTDFGRYALSQSINGGSWREIYKGGNESWTAYNAGPNTYSYRVLGIAGDGTALSSVVSITVSNPPASPSIMEPPPVTGVTYRVAWSAESNADQYILEESAVGGGWTSVYMGSSNYLDVVNASPGDYSYRVKACQNSACSEFSVVKIFTVRTIDSIIQNYILSD
jgi:hypothetical protein